MSNVDLKLADRRLIAGAAGYARGGGFASRGGTWGLAGNGTLAPNIPTTAPAIIPGRGPVSMPMAMPGPGSGYNRYREMTLEEMLLENRVVFLVGEINHVSASRVIMQMLYLQSVKRDQDINLYIKSPGGGVA